MSPYDAVHIQGWIFLIAGRDSQILLATSSNTF